MSNPWKTAWNFLTASSLFMLSLLLLWQDLAYPGDLMFLTPSDSLVWLLVLTIGWYFCALIFSVFPKRFLFLLILLLLSRTAFGFPFNAWMGNTMACVTVSSLVCLTTFSYAMLSVFRRGDFNLRPWFRLKHSVAVMMSGVALLLLSIPLMAGGFASGTRNLLGDYTRFSLSSVSLVERVFQRAGKKVFLTGMMHIGEGQFYEELNRRIEENTGARRVVLAEGVADRNKILPESFASGSTYAKWARWLGLQVQSTGNTHRQEDAGKIKHHFKGRGVEIVQADIDVSELPEEHRLVLVKALQSLESMRSLVQLDLDPHEFEVLMKEGLLKFRNDRLMEHFATVIDQDYEEIYIPWGAAHLPDIEERLKKMGFEKIGEEIRPVIRFWKR